MHQPKTTTIKISKLNPDPDNTKIHNKENIELIKSRLLKFGQYRPFVVQKNGMRIRIGNGMYQAMKDIGIKEAKAIILDIDDKEAVELSIGDNKASELGSFWDDEALSEIFKDLDLDLDIIGFSENEIKEYLPEEKDLEEKINASTEYLIQYDEAEKRVERVNKKMKDLKKQNPELLSKAKMIVLDGRKGNECLVLIDDSLSDIIKELKRYHEQGESSPLEKLINTVHKL